jgi:hypothetical protein
VAPTNQATKPLGTWESELLAPTVSGIDFSRRVPGAYRKYRGRTRSLGYYDMDSQFRVVTVHTATLDTAYIHVPMYYMYRALRVNTKNLIRESCCEIGVFILSDSRYLWLTPGTYLICRLLLNDS